MIWKTISLFHYFTDDRKNRQERKSRDVAAALMRDAFNASSKKNIFMKHSVSFNVTEADIQLGDQLSDSDLELHYTFNNPQEKYVHGMGKGKEVSRANVNVSIREDGERAGYAAKNFLAGNFVCEYAATVKLKETSLEEQETYKSLGLGCFCLDAEYNGKMYTFDATATINDPGRYINHRSRDYNLVIMKPIFINGKLRIGLSAQRDIKCGEEFYFDYGVRDKEIPWLITKPTKRKKKSKHVLENIVFLIGALQSL